MEVKEGSAFVELLEFSESVEVVGSCAFSEVCFFLAFSNHLMVFLRFGFICKCRKLQDADLFEIAKTSTSSQFGRYYFMCLDV